MKVNHHDYASYTLVVAKIIIYETMAYI